MGTWASELHQVEMEKFDLVWWITFSLRSCDWRSVFVSLTRKNRWHEDALWEDSKPSRGCVMLWAMICHQCECHFHMYHLTNHYCGPSTSLHVQYFLMAVSTFSWIAHPTTQQKWLKNGLSSTITSSKSCLGLLSPQVLVQLSICGMCCKSYLASKGPTQHEPSLQSIILLLNVRLWTG